MTSTEKPSNTTAPTQYVTAGENTYAYRQLGLGPRAPLLFLQHFTGTLDNWDPAVTDPLAQGRTVILFESAGIGRSTGKVPETVAEMAAHAMKFLDALGLTRVDVLGFSLGGMVAQVMALKRPALLRKIILTGAARVRSCGPRETYRPWHAAGPDPPKCVSSRLWKALGLRLLDRNGDRARGHSCLQRPGDCPPDDRDGSSRTGC